MLNSGCSEEQELKRIWNKIQEEAQSSAEWLGADIPEVLATPTEGIGGKSVSGSLEHETPGPNPFGGGQTCLVPTKRVWWGPNLFDKEKIANMCLKMWGLI